MYLEQKGIKTKYFPTSNILKEFYDTIFYEFALARKENIENIFFSRH